MNYPLSNSSKSKLRLEIIDKLSAIDIEQKAEKDIAINQSLIEFFKDVKKKKILSFKPLKSEQDISEFNQFLSANNDLYYSDKKHLRIYDEHNRVFTKFDDFEFIIVPALAVTRDGIRLGRGGGWYDRLLTQTSAQRVCPIYKLQILDSIPIEEHDQRIDIIVDELETINCKNFA